MPITIGIGGSGSGSGKTAFACLLLERLKGWGAIKYTPEAVYSSVIDDPEILGEKGKDTEMFIRAGAAEVLWVRSAPEDLEETLGIALGRLSHLKGIVVEGNSAIEVLKPDIVIFLDRGEKDEKDKEELKGSARRAFDAADIVIGERVSCAHARRLAEATGIAYAEVGRMFDDLRVKITSCELGCF